MKCKYCHAEIEQDAQFCPNCGRDLSKISRCVKCGELLDKGTSFCPYCGVEQPHYDESTGIKKWPFVILFLLVLGGGLYFAIKLDLFKPSVKTNVVTATPVTTSPLDVNTRVEDDVPITTSSHEEDTRIEDDASTTANETGTNISYYMSGHVSDYPITMYIEINGTQVKGYYYYDRQYEKKGMEAKLNLSGTNDSGQLDLNETNSDGTPTGHFRGKLRDVIFKGQFINTKGEQMPFSVSQ